MDMHKFESLESIKSNIEAQRQLISLTDTSIQNITGRLPFENRRIPNTNFNSSNTHIANQNATYNRYERKNYKNSIWSNNPQKSNYERPEEDNNISIPSSVVKVGDKRSRVDAINELKSSDKDRARRMFGFVQTTLNQFKVESAAATELPKSERRRQLDAKVEAKAVTERESSRTERINLFRKRQQQLLDLSLLNEKMRIISEFESWKEEMMKMIGFTRTDTSPHIFFQPKQHNADSLAKLKKSETKILELVNQKHRQLEVDFKEMSTAKQKKLEKKNFSNANKMPADIIKTQNEVDSDHDEVAKDFPIPKDLENEEEDDDDYEEEFEVGIQSRVVAASVLNGNRKVSIISCPESDDRKRTVHDGLANVQSDDGSENFDVDEPLLVEDEQQSIYHSPIRATEHDRRRVLFPRSSLAVE